MQTEAESTAPAASFKDAPLITPERLASEPLKKVFGVVPEWAKVRQIVTDPDLPPADQVIVVLPPGEASPQEMFLSPAEFAVLCEITRYEHSVVCNRNTNPSRPEPQRYPKFTWYGTKPNGHRAVEDNFPVQRVLMGAGYRQAVKLGRNPKDLRTEELEIVGSGKATKDARSLALHYASTVIPAEGAPADYLHNIGRLFALVDAEAGVSREAAA